ncbi:DUF6314 family protein [Lapillicoccus jejuensis]
MLSQRAWETGGVTETRTPPTDLLGEWAFQRRIDDRAGRRRGTVQGRMRLLEQPDGRVLWQEKGELRWPGSDPLPVQRTLYVVPREDDEDAWMVTFADGRDFHPWRPGEVVEHPCNADLYRGLVHPPTPGSRGWSVMWECTGPDKDYSMTTLVRPA